MREFRYENVRGEQMVDGDPLHERWLARDATGCDIVLLKLRPEHAAREDVRTAWLEQAARNVACQSAGLLSVLDYGMHQGAAFLARQHAPDALPLSALIAYLEGQGESVSVLLSVHILRALCETLGVAHAQALNGRPRPLLHGDLSAERVFVRADGRLQMAELGLYAALPVQQSVALRTGERPPEYLAPELVHGVPMDPRTDVYALGVLLGRMLMKGDGPVGGGATRKIAPILPPREMLHLITVLTATSPADRPSSAIALQRELAPLACHAAGPAVLAQLHEDTRTRQTPQPAQSAPPDVGLSAKKTAMFIAPRTPGGDGRMQTSPSPAREAPSGFRGRTQVFGASVAQPANAASAPQAAPAQDEPPTLAPSASGPSGHPPGMLAPSAPTANIPSPSTPASGVPAPSTAGAFGTLRLTASELPPLLTIPSPTITEGLGDDLPPLLSGHGHGQGEARGNTSRLDLTGMPPLLSHADTERPPPANDVAPRVHLPPVAGYADGAAAREMAPPLRMTALEQTPAHHQSGDFSIAQNRRPSIRPGQVDPAISVQSHQSGMRPSPTLRTPDPEIPPLAPLPHPDRAPRMEDVPSASDHRKRELWREASETVFKMKVPAMMARMTPRERMSPVVMFVIAMVVAAVLIIGIRLLVGLFV